MVDMISIGTAAHIDLLKSRLDTEFGLLANDGMIIDCEEKPKGGYVFLGYNVADYGNAGYSAKDTDRIFKHYIADVVSDIIINRWENNLINNIIQENYYYFNTEEMKTIYEYTLQKLDHLDDSPGDKVLYRLSRKSLVLQKLMEYLHNNSQIIIEGFIRFRLKEYIQELRLAVDKAVDDFMLEREYKEFIRLLKYFVDIQEPRVEKVHVLMKSSGFFKLLDGQNNNINNEYLEGFIFDLVDSEINHEDLLISALITIAPNNIVLHFKESTKFSHMLETIKNVFGDKVQQCSGCNLCKNTKNLEQ